MFLQKKKKNFKCYGLNTCNLVVEIIIESQNIYKFNLNSTFTFNFFFLEKNWMDFGRRIERK